MSRKIYIEKVKQENGNEKLTNRDMLLYLMGKVDDISDVKMDKTECVAKDKVSTNTFWRITSIFGASYGVIITVLLYIIFGG